MLLLQRLQFYLAVNCHQAKAKLARDAAPLQLRYPDLKECEALVRLGLRYTDKVRARLDLFDSCMAGIHLQYYARITYFRCAHNTLYCGKVCMTGIHLHCICAHQILFVNAQ